MPSRGFTISLCGALVAEACNIGFEPLLHPEQPALAASGCPGSRRTSSAPRPSPPPTPGWWPPRTPCRSHGSGERRDRLGRRHPLRRPQQPIHAGPNPRYFGIGRGITYYNLVSDQFTGLNAIVVPGTLEDSLVILGLLLEQETDLEPAEIMTDTGAYAD